jgi:hypothetical protein
MAGIADQLIGSVLQSSQQAPDVGQAITRGADLATHIENIQDSRAKLELAKQQQLINKIEKVGQMYEISGKLQGKGQRFMYEKAIPNTIKALDLDKYFPDSTQAFLSSDPYAVSYLKSQIRQDPGALNKILPALQDQSGEQLAQMYPEIRKFGALAQVAQQAGDDLKGLEDAQKFAMSEAGKTERAKMVQTGQTTRQTTQIESAPKTEYAKKVGDIAAKYNADGGNANAQKQLQAIDEVIADLKSGKIKLGTIGKQIPYGDREAVLSRTDPQAKAALDKVRGAMNLRAALADPNPTERQMNAVLGRAIDPTLSNDLNIDKLTKARNELAQAVDARQREFQKYGFASAPTAPAKKPFKKLSSAAQAIVVKKIMEQTGQDEATVRSQLEAQ